MDRYQVTVTGETPLLMHHDNLKWAGVMKEWQTDPANKKASVPGDDRSPAFTWIGYLYRAGGHAVIPSDNLMTAIREGGAKCPTGKGQQTFKSLSQSGILVDQPEWDLVNAATGEVYSVDAVEELLHAPEFEEQERWARERGFELFSKRARVGQKKHVRVRPRFDSWGATGTVTVLEPRISKQVLTNIWTYAGAYSGLGDWRPSSPKSPGQFGRFSVTVDKL